MSLPSSNWAAGAFQKTVTNVFYPRGLPTRRRRSRRPAQQISLESLEPRQMLSVNPASSGSSASSATDNSNIAAFISQNTIGILAVVPGSPTSVVAVSGNTSLFVTWTAPASDGGSAITDYLVKYSANNGATWTNFNDGVSTATACTVTGLTNGTAYVIKVIAKNAVGISPPSANSAPATPSLPTTTFQVINNFAPGGATSYFGNTYANSAVWLYFINTSGNVTYSSNTVPSTVSDNTAIQLSTVDSGTFSIAVGSASTRVWAALGVSNPFTQGQPQQFQQNIPYALAEWTVNGNSYDNVDVSYEDSFSFPTVLQVVNSAGTQTAGFPLGTTASSVVSALNNVLPSPVGPGGVSNPNYPNASLPLSNPGIGWSPVPTISNTPTAVRPIGSSKYQVMGPDSSNNFTMYQYIPSFNDYLGYLQAHTPNTVVNSNLVAGYYVDYSGDNGYSGYVTITGSNNNYGMQISNIRVNTSPSAVNNWQADPTAGNAASGTITIAANGASVDVTSSGAYTAAPTGFTMNGFWTDLTLASGASLINGDFATGPIITGTGDFAAGGANVNINPTFIASISASMATGLLGSTQYMNGMWSNPSTGQLIVNPGGTMRWFQTTTRQQSTQILFDKAWSGGQPYYDPFWATLANQTGMEGYLSPFNDRWSNFSPDFTLDPTANSNVVTWQLGSGSAATVPSAPTSVVATSGNTSLGVTWVAPASNGGSNIIEYIVKYSSNNGAAWTRYKPSSPITATSCTVTGLTNGTAYVIKVIAKNAVGISPPSANSAPATPAATVPGSPTAVVAVSGNASLAVSWTAPANTGGSAITDYLVKYSSNSGASWTRYRPGLPITATACTVTGLTNGTAYVIKVIAKNAVGISLPSASSAPATPAATVSGSQWVVNA